MHSGGRRRLNLRYAGIACSQSLRDNTDHRARWNVGGCQNRVREMRPGQNPDFGSQARGGDDDEIIDRDAMLRNRICERREIGGDTRRTRSPVLVIGATP